MSARTWLPATGSDPPRVRRRSRYGTLAGVLDFGGSLGIGSKYFAAPWRAFTFDEDGKRLVVSVSEGAAGAVAGFVESQVCRLMGRQLP